MFYLPSDEQDFPVVPVLCHRKLLGQLAQAGPSCQAMAPGSWAQPCPGGRQGLPDPVGSSDKAQPGLSPAEELSASGCFMDWAMPGGTERSGPLSRAVLSYEWLCLSLDHRLGVVSRLVLIWIDYFFFGEQQTILRLEKHENIWKCLSLGAEVLLPC